MVSYRIDAKRSEDDEINSIHSMIMPVTLHHVDDPRSEIVTYALLDNQSDACFIGEDLLQKLKAPAQRVTLELTTVLTKQVVQSQVIRGLVVTGLNQSDKISLPATYSRSCIPANKNLIPRPETIQCWPHLKGIPLHPLQENTEIGLLIGINCSRALLPREIVAAGDDDPYAVRTLLGWGVTGNMCRSEAVENTTRPRPHFVYRTSTKEITPKEVRQMFDMEFCEGQTDKLMSGQDLTFMKKMDAGLQRRQDGHIQLPLPLKEDDLCLPNNRTMALKRLQGLKRKMITNDKYRDDYKTFMADMIDKGYAEKVPEDAEEPQGRVWYIPHHGVYHPRKPHKIRVVFDCSAKYENHTLNEHLLSGPDLINSLTGVLLRFRKEAVAVTCDIEAMFLQVGVNPKDRDLLRFVWWEDGDLTKLPRDYRMCSHLFGATSSPGCANYALKRAASSGEIEDERAREFIKNDFYVDDGLTSVSTSEEALKLITSSRKLCKEGGFNLTKFISNSKDVVEALPREVRAKGIQNIDFKIESLPVERALGVRWCIESDTLQFRVILQDKPATRRGLLSTLSSVFDPIGLISPFLLTGKKLLQDLCKDNAEWDDPLPDDIRSRWELWRDDLLNLATLQIPRCYKPTDFGDLKKAELHHFSDACQTGYGQCSYLRLIDESANVACSLVFAKSRVAPVKPVTIPRLELTAATTSVKISSFLNKELNYESITNVYWTDSTVVLGYIANEARRFHVFVANRVQRIRDATTVEQWNYINTKENPADLASRGATADQIINNTAWWHGPAFLSAPQQIPLTTVNAILASDDPEVKIAVSYSTGATDQPVCGLLSRLEYFSSWFRAKRAVAVCINYTRILRDRIAKKGTKGKLVKGDYTPVDVTDIQHAEKLILRVMQLQEFPEEAKSLSKLDKQRGRASSQMKRRSPIHRLDPYMGADGLIRVGGRVRRANIPQELAHPVILPKKGHVTMLIIRHHHERTLHSGRQTTLNEIRASGYWIIKARAAVASYVWKCVTCNKLRGAAAGQKMADLPPERLEPAPPFTMCGVDLFGPFYVKEGRSERKRWGCLFTCLITRAIHIEVVHSLSTDSFLHAYRRFVGRRGPVRQIRCDQGTNFVGARNELQAALEEMNHDKVQQTLLQDGCDWVQFRMNVPTASHMGGIWERMVRSARTVLCAILDQHSHQLDDEALHTFMTEVEAVVNSRPLTYVDMSSADSEEPLTPNQLLTLKSQIVLPLPGSFVREDLFCRKRWRRVQYLANQFWTRWRKEYLPTLQERVKWIKAEDNLQRGDIVLMMSENVPRGQWPKGVIVDTYPSDDGYVRKASVKTASGTFDRPIHKLVLLLRPGIPTKEP